MRCCLLLLFVCLLLLLLCCCCLFVVGVVGVVGVVVVVCCYTFGYVYLFSAFFSISLKFNNNKSVLFVIVFHVCNCVLQF
jgi:hypothetical protein